MITLDILRSADHYHWLGSGWHAGNLLGCNQSTVSRHVQSFNNVFTAFDQSLQQRLISLEREVHQHWRFRTASDLRIHLYPWTNRLTAKVLPDYWHANPLAVATTHLSALELLQSRTIDAVCAPYPVFAAINTDQLSLIPMYATPLTLLADRHSPLAHETNLTASDIASASQFGTLDFVPVEASSCSQTADAQIFGSSDSPGNQRFWGTALSMLARPNLRLLDYNTNIDYQEYLAVLPEWSDHPCVQHLRENLANPFKSHSFIHEHCAKIQLQLN